MVYDLKLEHDVNSARSYFHKLVEDKSRIELTKKQKRTLNQNNYLHLLLSIYGLHFGYTLIEAKAIYKALNEDIYYYEKNGITFIKSSSTRSTKQIHDSIEKFRDHSAKVGKYLPEPNEKEMLQYYEKETKNNSRWL